MEDMDFAERMGSLTDNQNRARQLWAEARLKGHDCTQDVACYTIGAMFDELIRGAIVEASL